MAKRVCFIGPMLSGSGYVKTQGEILADLLQESGYVIFRKSKFRNRVLRFFDTVFFLLLRPSKYDVLIVQVYGGLSFYLEDAASFLASLFKKKIIMTLHGGNLPVFFKTRKSWGRRVLNRANVVTCPSLFLKDKLIDLSIPLLEIPNIIKVSDYHFTRRESFFPRILWMRAYHEIYNPYLALHSFEELLLKYPEATLTMAGPDMGLYDEICKYCSSFPLKDRVLLLKKIDLREKQLLALKHDIYLNTNRVDNAPVSMLEMAAFGLALISTNVGGVSYLFRHGETALLCEENTKAIVAAIEDVIQNPVQTAERINRARNFILQFDEAPILMQWKSLI